MRRKLLILIIINLFIVWILFSVLKYQEIISHLNIMFETKVNFIINRIDGPVDLFMIYLFNLYKKNLIETYGNLDDRYNAHIKQYVNKLWRLVSVYYDERIRFNYIYHSSKYLYFIFNYLGLFQYNFSPYIKYIYLIQLIISIIIIIYFIFIIDHDK